MATTGNILYLYVYRIILLDNLKSGKKLSSSGQSHFEKFKAPILFLQHRYNIVIITYLLYIIITCTVQAVLFDISYT